MSTAHGPSGATQAPDTNNAPDLPIPPARYWHLSPTWTHWTKLSAWDIATTLRTAPGFEGQKVLFYRNSPVRYVYLVGAVVSVDVPSATLAVIVLDDCSGACIEAVIRGAADVQGLERGADELTLLLGGRVLVPGDVLRVKGELDAFRGVRQVLLRRVGRVEGTGMEVDAWKARATVRRELERGWRLSDEDRRRVEEEMLKEEIKERSKLGRVEAHKRKRAEHEMRKTEREARREDRRREQEKRLNTGALI